MRTDRYVKGVFALELAGGSAPARDALLHAEAGRLAERLGRDLAALAPQARELDLILAGAHFDPAEALRPGWPLHRRLQDLAARAPGRGGPAARLIAFGADADGTVPAPLQADPELRGGSLRVLPFLLQGEPETIDAVDAVLEEALLERGMAAADTALLAQEGLDARIEHARYLTAHDLAAMIAMQYAHQGLDPLWPVIEASLFDPAGEAWLDAAPEPLLRYADGEGRIALFAPNAWCAHYGLDDADCERMERRFGHFQARQRQLAAVLEAHGIPTTFVHCRAGEDARAALTG